MEIILATDSHVPEIVELWKEFMDFHKNIDSFYTRSKKGHLNFKKHVKDLIKSDDSQVLVALKKGHVIAFSTAKIAKYPPVFRHKTYGVIGSMAVKSNYQRKGIGKRMLAKIYEWFESRKIHRIELRVVTKNQIGYSFWKKYGFKDRMHILCLNK